MTDVLDILANRPLPLGEPATAPAARAADAALAPLLHAPFSRAFDAPAESADSAARVRERLLVRTQASRADEAAMVTMRRRRAAPVELGTGVVSRTLYQAADGRAPRPGEPLLVRVLDLAPGAALRPEWLGQADRHREVLVLSGRVGPSSNEGDAATLGLRDYHVLPAGSLSPDWHAGADGAALFVRESMLAAVAGDVPHTVRDAEAGWPDYAPGIRRRILWQRGDEAALLWYAQAGAQVPRHTHGHDEECLMVQGELYLDDVLLMPGDYQLAPAGTGHHMTQTDTGVVIYAHGDVDLRFVG